MDALIIVVLGLLGIVAASTLGARIGVAAPLLLVVVGIGVSLLPWVPAVHIDPEWILAGVLPPLLYSASVSMPSMDFRREFGSIGALSVLLVVVSSLVLGAFFTWVIPGLGIWWGIALGAIVSPTDAVATSIAKKLPVSPRVVSILEGESLLNDATALVLLRTAIAGTAASVSLWSVLGKFAFAVVVAVVIGFLVGKVNLMVRARITDSTANTVISFTVPFLASIPAEELGASGLVAAVVAGLVTGYGAPRTLSPSHRLSDAQNWRTVELVLEGSVFLVMGLELSSIIEDVRAEHQGIPAAILVAAGALALTVVVRAVYVAPLLRALQAVARRREKIKPTLHDYTNQLENPEQYGEFKGRRGDKPWEPSDNQLERFKTRLRRTAADIDYYLAAPLGWREGTVVVWAGMRGAVTLAAAQTLPEDTPSRPLLILIAFLVAAGSLILQGGTLKRVVLGVGSSPGTTVDSDIDERRRILELLDSAAVAVVSDGSSKRYQLAVLDAQRQAVLDARDDGLFDGRMLATVLEVLDADQISLELKGGPDD
ncbi:NhaP-type Na+/H+ or K+/H+ antiporter [Rhodococcus sp. 27YEA15]|uniref:cation:proton antiporter n=1 Tax=Rhodococcus sp. 27YEA15 TaxID=3156259 RepID=UPI003C7AC056